MWTAPVGYYRTWVSNNYIVTSLSLPEVEMEKIRFVTFEEITLRDFRGFLEDNRKEKLQTTSLFQEYIQLITFYLFNCNNSLFVKLWESN